MDLTVRQLEALLAVDEHGSFTRAAEELHMTQPAVSRTIAMLERRLGKRLIDRSAVGASLTAVGCEVAEHGRAVITRLGLIESLAQRPTPQPLRVGAVASSLVNLVPAALERLQSELPTSQVLAVRGDDDELRDWLTAGTVDLSVSTTPIANVASASPVLDELVAVLPAHHNLVEKERIDLVALAATGVVDPGGTCGTILASAFAKSGISWQPNYTVREVSAMISIAAANIAVGIVPAIAAPQPSSCDVVLRPVCPALRRRLYIYYESRHKVAERFAAFLTDIGNQVASRYSEIT